VISNRSVPTDIVLPHIVGRVEPFKLCAAHHEFARQLGIVGVLSRRVGTTCRQGLLHGKPRNSKGCRQQPDTTLRELVPLIGARASRGAGAFACRCMEYWLGPVRLRGSVSKL
jgi:hypothetical protein